MLVHCKNPNGILHLSWGKDKYIIYGRESGRDPVDLPWEIYNTCRDGLEDATYREGVLSRMFGKPFPVVAFKYSEIRFLPEKTLDIIGPLMIDDYQASFPYRKKLDNIKCALRGEDARYKTAAISRWK